MKRSRQHRDSLVDSLQKLASPPPSVASGVGSSSRTLSRGGVVGSVGSGHGILGAGSGRGGGGGGGKLMVDEEVGGRVGGSKERGRRLSTSLSFNKKAAVATTTTTSTTTTNSIISSSSSSITAPPTPSVPWSSKAVSLSHAPSSSTNSSPMEREAASDDATDNEASGSSVASDEKASSTSSSSSSSSSSHVLQRREEQRALICQMWKKLSSSSSSSSSGKRKDKGKSHAKGAGGKKPKTPPPTRPPDLVSMGSAKDAASVLIPCAYPGSEERLLWYCEECESFHALTSTSALTPFTKRHGMCMKDVDQDGDCFYSCVVNCMLTEPEVGEKSTLTVEKLREAVARRVTQEQLEFYRMEAAASPKASHLDFVRPPKAPIAKKRKLSDDGPAEVPAAPSGPLVDSLTALRSYVRREGRLAGQENCLWADSFAQMVVADELKLTILLVDMERERGCFPYRFLHRFKEKGSEPPPDPSKKRSSSRLSGSAIEGESLNLGVNKNTPERFIILKRQGPVGHFMYVERDDGQACFLREDLPEIVKRLWEL